MAKKQSQFICQQCGASAPRWQGRCADCGAWNSLVEEVVEKKSSAPHGEKKEKAKASRLEFEDLAQGERESSCFKEFDRVLGGGFVPGSLVLIGGEPGIGKSTLLLQLLSRISQLKKSIYISGEESKSQVASRAKRITSKTSENLFFISTQNLEEAMEAIESSEASFVVVDSIQTLSSSSFESVAGSVSQVRAVCHELLEITKRKNLITMLVGQITKDGSLAGPKLVEHMVDAVFYFEMSSTGSYRLLRSQKNRFGAAGELAVFEMTSKGLEEIANPSERFLAERAREMAGSAVVSHLEGSQSFLTEVQSLTTRCYQGYPRRTAQGVDHNRMSVLIAIIEKTLGLSFAELDVYCKVASGARVDEPASDLAILFSLYSAATQKALPADILLMGEVGLGGELRSIPGIQSRIKEAKAVGIRRVILPVWNHKELKSANLDIEVLPMKNILEVKKCLF